MNDVSAFTLFQAPGRACTLAHEFINGRVRPRVMAAFQVAPTAEANVFAGALHRVMAWTSTLSRLIEPADFQAGIVAVRTLFEIAVDVTLMHFEPNTYPFGRLVAWEDSAKLRAAIRIREFFRRRGEQPGPQFRPHRLWDAPTAVEFDDHRRQRIVTAYGTMAGVF